MKVDNQRKPKGKVAFNYSDNGGVRGVKVTVYDKDTPAECDWDTVCLEFWETDPIKIPFRIYMTWDEAVAISTGLLNGVMMEYENQQGELKTINQRLDEKQEVKV